MSHTSVRPGSMTTAMSAVQGAAPKVLRVGVVSNGSVVDERIVRDRQTITAGPTERCTLSVRAESVPAAIELFVPHGAGYGLVLHPGAELRVATAEGPRTLDALRAQNRVVTVGGREVLALEVTDRGKLTLGSVIFLFQFVNAPPAHPRPQLPASLKSSYVRSADWRYNACVASFMAVAIAGLGYVEYLWDPVVPSDSEISDMVARMVHMEAQPPSAPTEPAQPDDADERPAEAAANAPQSAPTTAPRTANPAPRPRSNQPTPSDVSQAQRDAQRIAANAIHGLDGVFAPLTSATRGVNGTARDQLANNGLLANNANDLQNLHGISTEPGALDRGRMAANNVFLPSGTSLGRTRLRDPGPAPGPLGPTAERVITTTLVCHLPSEPLHQTCDEDATSVARTFRSSIGGLRSCYERGVRNDPNLRGRVSLSFTLGASGRATGVHASGLNDEVDACLASAVQRIVFTQPTCGAADFTFPITFEQGAR